MLKFSGDRPGLTVGKESLRINDHLFKVVKEFLHKNMS